MDNTTDTGVVRLVVLGLFAIAFLGLAGSIFLIDRDTNIEAVAVITGLTGTAVGSLAALLASTKSVNVQGLADLAEAQRQNAAVPPDPLAANPEPAIDGGLI